ncbi:MAG: hypothetical protein H6755_05780 [Candidatus Omnitrophica bacterium]|nr:hypothetical protein [Candidatus Omnitrophota bacterium]
MKKILGIIFFLVILLINPVTIGIFFSPDGHLNTESAIFILAFDFFCFLLAFFYLSQHTVMSGFFRQTFVILVSCLVTFLLIEIGLRFINYGQRLGANIDELTEGRYIQHTMYNPFLIFGPHINKKYKQENDEYSYWNAQGFRLQEMLPKEKALNEYRIFALGGSTTANGANGMNLHYCEEANQILADTLIKGKNIHCVNSALVAGSSAHTLVRLQFDLLDFKPDMITVMHNINDLFVNLFPVDDRRNYGNKFLHEFYAPTFSTDKRKMVVKRLINSSRLLQFIQYRFEIVRQEKFLRKVPAKNGQYVLSSMRFADKAPLLPFKEVFRRNLISICRIAKANNIKVVLITQPAVFSQEKIALGYGHKKYNDIIFYPPLDQWKEFFETYNQVVKDVALTENVFFIDMYSLMGHDENDFKDMVHYSATGIRKFAKIYADNIHQFIEINKE